MQKILQTNSNEFCASPKVCKELIDLGLTLSTSFRWRINPIMNTHEVQTFIYDMDGYYELASENIDAVYQPIYLPAFTISDFDNILPAYSISKLGTVGYEVMIDDIWKVEPVSELRMPDALALMTKSLLISRQLCIETVNKIISFPKAQMAC